MTCGLALTEDTLVSWEWVLGFLAKTKVLPTESQLVVSRGRGLTDGYLQGAHFGAMGMFWNWVEGVVAQHCECTKCHGTVHLKMVDVMNFTSIRKKEKPLIIGTLCSSCNCLRNLPWHMK